MHKDVFIGSAPQAPAPAPALLILAELTIGQTPSAVAGDENDESGDSLEQEGKMQGKSK
ncbi:hypothetical protein CBOM_01051 [Ceraceosorus bombacis]|uniref:Uncharacterized protein n=1 Tax=Ceraceosorus bombacis TaxID=401625 RepID=A0A0P1BAM8_9BASI|nr:hypothetical protein CBOM_01051 [Ceraceosorus bombacis]